MNKQVGGATHISNRDQNTRWTIIKSGASGSGGVRHTLPSIPLTCHFMERTRCTVARITDYRRYHLSGDLEQVVHGKVEATIHQLEMSQQPIDEAAPEQLKSKLELEKEHTEKLQQQVQAMELRNALEREKMEQEQWETAIQWLKEAREEAAQEHQKHMAQLNDLAEEA